MEGWRDVFFLVERSVPLLVAKHNSPELPRRGGWKTPRPSSPCKQIDYGAPCILISCCFFPSAWNSIPLQIRWQIIYLTTCAHIDLTHSSYPPEMTRTLSPDTEA